MLALSLLCYMRRIPLALEDLHWQSQGVGGAMAPPWFFKFFYWKVITYIILTPLDSKIDRRSAQWLETHGRSPPPSHPQVAGSTLPNDVSAIFLFFCIKHLKTVGKAFGGNQNQVYWLEKGSPNRWPTTVQGIHNSI